MLCGKSQLKGAVASGPGIWPTCCTLKEGNNYLHLILFLPTDLLMVFPIGQTQPEAREQERTCAKNSGEKGREWIWKGKWKTGSMDDNLTQLNSFVFLFDREPRASGSAAVKSRSRKSHCHCTHFRPYPV